MAAAFDIELVRLTDQPNITSRRAPRILTRPPNRTLRGR
jgi:hypothetical protein